MWYLSMSTMTLGLPSSIVSQAECSRYSRRYSNVHKQAIIHQKGINFIIYQVQNNRASMSNFLLLGRHGDTDSDAQGLPKSSCHSSRIYLSTNSQPNIGCDIVYGWNPSHWLGCSQPTQRCTRENIRIQRTHVHRAVAVLSRRDHHHCQRHRTSCHRRQQQPQRQPRGT